MKKLIAFLAATVLTSCLGGGAAVQDSELRPAQTTAEIAFAKNVLNAAQTVSFASNREYCGYIGLDENGAFIATPAKRGRKSSCLSRQPAGFRVLASYHTHGAYAENYDVEVPSDNDLRADTYEGIDGYIGTPGGRVWYTDSERGIATLICGLNCIQSDPDFVRHEVLPVGTVFDLDDLENR